MYFVSPGQLNVLVPFSTTGPTATIVVQNAGANSNTVTVPVAATSPGIYALDQSGSGDGAILHADYSLVNAAKPAVARRDGPDLPHGARHAYSPALADGTAGTSGTLYNAATDLTVYVGGQPGNVLFKGQAPGFPGLYQVNVTLPQFLKASGRCSPCAADFHGVPRPGGHPDSMTITINLPDEKAAMLQEQANARGLTIEHWFLELAEPYLNS